MRPAHPKTESTVNVGSFTTSPFTGRRESEVHGAQTAARALDLLELLVRSNRPLGLTEIANLAEIDKSAAHRLLRELESRAYLAREPDGRRYVLGTGLLALATAVLSKVDIRSLARPVMARLVDRTGETASLHVRHLRHRICVEVAESTQAIRQVPVIGETRPLYVGPSGKAILAALLDAEVASILDLAREEGQDVAQLEGQIHAIRRRGYVTSIDDPMSGMGALSVPIFNAQGVAASLTVAGPAERWTPEAIDEAAPAVQREGEQLSVALGHVRGPASTA